MQKKQRHWDSFLLFHSLLFVTNNQFTAHLFFFFRETVFIEYKTVKLAKQHKEVCFTTTEQDTGTMKGRKLYYSGAISGQSF